MGYNSLVIYGEAYVGKTILEYNLRKYYCGTARCDSSFQVSDRLAFMGRTYKKSGGIMYVGGSDAGVDFSELPDADWFICSLTCKGLPIGRYGNQHADIKAFLGISNKVVLISLYTTMSCEFMKKRVLCTRGRVTTRKLRPARYCAPPKEFIDLHTNLVEFKIDSTTLDEAFKVCCDTLGKSYFYRYEDYSIITDTCLFN